MTPQAAAQCRTIVFEYLTSKGYPDNLTDQQIIDEIPAIHKRLSDEKLIPSTFTAEKLKEIATIAYKQVQMAVNLGAQMGAQFGFGRQTV
jgi:hypothetical protein